MRKMRFQVGYVLLNGANVNFNKYLVPSYVYDVDPAVGSTAVPGFTELAAIYRNYRMRSFRYWAQFANLDNNTAIQCCCCPSNIALTNNMAGWQAIFSNLRSNHALAATSTGNSLSAPLTGGCSIEDFSGVKWTGQLDAYCGPTSGSSAPVNAVYLFIGATTLGTPTFGATVDVVLDLEVEFFELLNPAT